MTRFLLPVLTISVVLFAVGGCTKKFIPNTEIEDTDENREIVSFCERYRHAVEDMNVGLLMSLAAPRYFYNNSTPSGDDDFDRNGLEEILASKFKSVKAMRYEIRYRNIFESHGMIYVEYTFNMSFQYEVKEKSKWANRTADNRLELERVDDGFLIVSGM